MYQVWLTELSDETREDLISEDGDVTPRLLVETTDKRVALDMINNECKNSVSGTKDEPALYSIVLCENGKPIVAHEVSAQYATAKV